jgi:hypothetical protein
MPIINPPYSLIRDELQKGAVIPFLGSGASIGKRNPVEKPWQIGESNHLPTSKELSNYLAEKITFPEDETKELSKVTQYYKAIAGGRQPLYEQLHTIFDKDFQSTSLHNYLSSIPAPLIIITTNYDDLIERSFAGREYDLVIHTTDIEYGDKILWKQFGQDEFETIMPNKLHIDLENRTVIYKMHGTINRKESNLDQYVITEDDYIEFLSRMTKNKAIPAIFAEPFQKLPFLFLGYSLLDWNLRVVLNKINEGIGSSKKEAVKSWAIQKNPSLLEQTFWLLRGVNIYDLDIDEFVMKLQNGR